MESLELGLHFYPSDIELLLLLKKRVQGEEHPSDFVIERDLYGPNSPWELFQDIDPWEREILDYENKEKKMLHVFTKLCHLSAKRIKRTSGCGTWSGESKGKDITSKSGRKGKILGSKKSFTFVTKSGSMPEVQGHWNMCEYSLADTKTDYVICKIIRSCPKSILEDELVADLVDSRPCKKLKCQASNDTVSAAPSFTDFSAPSFGATQSIALLDEAQSEVLSNFDDCYQEYPEPSATQEMQNCVDPKEGDQEGLELQNDMLPKWMTGIMEKYQASNGTVSVALSSTDVSASSFDVMQWINLPDEAQSEVFLNSVDCCHEYPDELHQRNEIQEMQNCVDSWEGDQLMSATPTSTFEAMQSIVLPDEAQSEALLNSVDCCQEYPDELHQLSATQEMQNCIDSWEGDQLSDIPRTEIMKMINFDDLTPLPDQEFSWAKIPGDAEFGFIDSSTSMRNNLWDAQ